MGVGGERPKTETRTELKRESSVSESRETEPGSVTVAGGRGGGGGGERHSKRHVKCRAARRVVCQSVTDVSHSECVCVSVSQCSGCTGRAGVCVCLRACQCVRV